MNSILSTEALAAMGVRVAILSSGRYAMPVPFRIRNSTVECRVPTWSGIGDLPEEPVEVMLVAAEALGQAETEMRWVYIRGQATVLLKPDWEGLAAPVDGRVSPEDLYQVLVIQPKRIELVDEKRGWGFRETVDL